MSNTNTGGPAFPTENARQTGPNSWHEEGMTLRQYAAIKLRVPNSGTDWLDEMIVQSLRDEFVTQAMQAMLEVCSTNQRAAEEAYAVADAMLKARES